MKCYLAHPVTDYGGTERQQRAIEAIQERGWTVESPDKPWHQEGYKAAGMDYFADLVRDCDALAFLPFPNGKIGAGVAQEIATALTRGLVVYDILAGFAPITMMPWNLLTVEETRAEIASIRSAQPGAAASSQHHSPTGE